MTIIKYVLAALAFSGLFELAAVVALLAAAAITYICDRDNVADKLMTLSSILFVGVLATGALIVILIFVALLVKGLS